jgi:hypothetical protein
MALVIPIWRLAGVAGLDPGIAIEAFEPREVRENFPRALGNLGLADFVCGTAVATDAISTSNLAFLRSAR